MNKIISLEKKAIPPSPFYHSPITDCKNDVFEIEKTLLWKPEVIQIYWNIR